MDDKVLYNTLGKRKLLKKKKWTIFRSTLFRCCLPCRGGPSGPGESNSKLEKKLSTGGGTTPVTTPTTAVQTTLSSPLIDTIVSTTLIGITTSSVTISTSSPTLTTPLLAAEENSNFVTLSNALQTVSSSSTTSTATSFTTIVVTSTTSSGATSTTTSLAAVPSSSSSSSSTASRQSQSSSHFPLTLPHIDEDDEDENGQCIALLPAHHLQYIRVVEKRVQNDNLINLNNVKSFTDSGQSSSLLTQPSPKIKVSKVKFSQQQQQLPASLTSSTSSESEATVKENSESVSPNKMQAETGTIAELQKYQNKYLKNRRHTLANTAINLR
ncbi:hypothetical protein PVAND_012185 [Polypedilum vanderplanki]|uniref:Uncharacterized protein n=1 Tax=Polypedilum vanderplanki TaxID=319348 RepID=A0A9J6CLN5_POLVA|nr:hypothetical protein PVAND_012185 [Polypedilum vanderplanki]